MIKKYKNYLLGVIGILLALTMLVGVDYLMQPKYEEIPEVKLINIKDNKSFAIMIQNGDNYEEYTSEDNKWPGSNYIYKEAKCIDNNGALVKDAITFADGKATLTTNKTIYCTLYFDEKPDPAKDLRAKDPSGNLSSDLQGGMYRYQGTDNVPNWICFGTRDADTCKSDPDGIDKYMYRIIGITEEGQMYLIKETFLKEGSGTTFSWNDKYYTSGSNSYTCENKICPEWGQNNLFKRLNGTSNGTIQGTGSYSDKADTDIFVDSSEYEYLKSGDSNGGESPSEWYNLIANHEWMYGDIGDTISLNTYKGQPVYEIETGNADVKHYVGIDVSNEEETYRWSQKANGKISLMYVHDYYYGYYDGSTEESRGNAGSYSKLKDSWLFFQKDGYNTSSSFEWLSTRRGINSAIRANVYAYYVDNDGDWINNDLYFASGVRPVFYLESSAKIASGEGTKDSPFILLN